MIKIRFVSFQYNRWRRALRKLRSSAIREEDRLPYRMATDYSDLLRANILSGKFDSAYRPYNLRYFDWKYFIFKSDYGFWRLRGELFKSISVFKHSGGGRKGWMGGIPSGETDSGNVSWLGTGNKGRRLPIAMYARWMEFGRRGQPERPLFQPTLVEYWRGGAVRQFGVTYTRLKGSWR